MIRAIRRDTRDGLCMPDWVVAPGRYGKGWAYDDLEPTGEVVDCRGWHTEDGPHEAYRVGDARTFVILIPRRQATRLRRKAAR